ncbi:12306_t:CDS:1, partial [Ambispora gerdemannii]
MASHLNELCLQKIFQYIIIDSDEDYVQQLFYCALVNRYWCINAVPLLWRNPFRRYTDQSQIISTLVKCFEYDKNHDQRPAFRYDLFIKEISLQDLVIAVDDLEMNEVFDRFKSYLLKLIDTTENSFFELSCYFENFDEKINYDKLKLNLFQLTNAKESLGKLKSLHISCTKDIEILESALKICPYLSRLEISASYEFESEYADMCRLLDYLDSFKNLRHLKINCGLVIAYEHGNEFLTRLGEKLPRGLETLRIEGDMDFSPASLEKFLHGAKQIQFKSLSFHESECIIDAHLEVILKVVKDSNLHVGIRELEISYITINQAQKLQEQDINIIVD